MTQMRASQCRNRAAEMEEKMVKRRWCDCTQLDHNIPRETVDRDWQKNVQKDNLIHESGTR